MQRRCGPPPDRYRLGCAAPRGPKGVLYLCRPMASNSTLQRPTAQRRRRRRRNPQVCGGERGQPNWITGALGPGRRGVHARGSAKPALPLPQPESAASKLHCFPGGLSRVQHQLELESTNGELAFTRARRRHGLDSEPTTSTHDPAAPTDYPTSPPAAAADTQAPGRRPPDAGAGPVPKVVNFEYRGWCSLFLGG